MNNDPRELLATSPMTAMQVAVVAITVGLTALDGFDVLSISFASPGIAHEWNIDRAALGVVLSMELLGMAIGSILLGGVADRVGRRNTLLGCLVLMTLGMTMVAGVRGLTALCAWRVITGLGIGGMLASNNAVAAEFSNSRRRDLSVSVMAIGYPLGAIIGGSIAAHLLKSGNWRVVFEFGAICTAIFFPIVFWCVPESVGWLCQTQPANALERVNRSLVRMGYSPVGALPVAAPKTGRGALIDIFRPGLALTTVLVTLTYFLHITTFYFILKWVPKIVVDMGFAPAAAAGVLVWANVGGATGGAVLGLLTQRLGLKPLTIAMLIGSTFMVAAFGHGQADLTQLSLICALAGFCTNGGIVGIYAVLARAFPTELRATGTGFAVGLGRGGAVIAPITAGFLFHTGFGLQAVAIIMGAGSLVAAACLALVPAKAMTPHFTAIPGATPAL
jgi:benzoate transport